MTDYTDLLRRLRVMPSKMAKDAADAIEALQKQVTERTADALRFSGKLAEYEQHSDECQLGIGPPCEALQKAEADNAALRERAEKYEAIAVAQTEAYRKAEAQIANALRLYPQLAERITSSAPDPSFGNPRAP